MKMIRALLLFVLLLLTACSVRQADDTTPAADWSAAALKKNPTDLPAEASVSDLPVLGKAPEIENEIWLNTDHPLRLAGLSGKVVLLDMWTFG